jgi:hypothetical protein
MDILKSTPSEDSSWTEVQIRPGDPTSPVLKVFSKEKTLEYFKAAEQVREIARQMSERDDYP